MPQCRRLDLGFIDDIAPSTGRLASSRSAGPGRCGPPCIAQRGGWSSGPIRNTHSPIQTARMAAPGDQARIWHRACHRAEPGSFGVESRAFRTNRDSLPSHSGHLATASINAFFPCVLLSMLLGDVRLESPQQFADPEQRLLGDFHSVQASPTIDSLALPGSLVKLPAPMPVHVSCRLGLLRCPVSREDIGIVRFQSEGLRRGFGCFRYIRHQSVS